MANGQRGMKPGNNLGRSSRQAITAPLLCFEMETPQLFTGELQFSHAVSPAAAANHTDDGPKTGLVDFRRFGIFLTIRSTSDPGS